MSRTKDQASGIALGAIAFVAVLLCIFVFAACGTQTSPGSAARKSTSTAPASTADPSSAKQDVADWYDTVAPDIDAFVTDSEAGDYSAAGLSVLLDDIHALQADPPFPASAPADTRNSWNLALADFDAGLTAAKNGDQVVGSEKLMDGTGELSAVTDYINSLNN
jgi:hypothetical protein